jgi:hypothetical protein
MDEMDRDVSIYPGSSPKLLEQPNKNPSQRLQIHGQVAKKVRS